MSEKNGRIVYPIIVIIGVLISATVLGIYLNRNLSLNKSEKQHQGEIIHVQEDEFYENIKGIIHKYSKIDTISISFYDFLDDKYIGCNDGKQYLGASTTKLPLAMLVCEKIDEGELSWHSTMIYSNVDYEEGTGVMFMDVEEDQLFTIKTMIYNMIVHSDNIATNMFYRYLGYSNTKMEMGQMIDTNIVTTDNIITTEQMNKFLILLYKKREDENFRYLVNILKETTFHDRLDKYLPYDIVAHKIGNYYGNVHDCGIIFTRRPYALTIYTNDVDNAEEIIAQISKEIYECYVESEM